MLSMPRYSHYHWLQSWPEGLFCVGLIGPSSPETIQEGGALPLPGSIWSQRDKKGNEHLAPTIHATIIQFNNVATCVMTTCLGDWSMKAPDRARVVEHWIEVAWVCYRKCPGITCSPSLPIRIWFVV
jgi:hypothetical protein